MSVPARSRRRGATGLIPVLLVAAAVAACGSAAAPSTDASAPPAVVPSTPAGSGPVGSGDAGQAITIDDLLADPAAKDGQLVRVTGNFLADEPNGARLCGLFMESYPPQCGGGDVRIRGEVPRATLDLLDTTTEPGLNKAWWGYVTVVGTFRAAGDDGKPAIDLGELLLVEG
ncbi:MAG TPA: hypothetical protein VD763_09195 [Candidatus Saccharimonadales bacterium]|nr:hypothetical protein [Candidatus Saccharimonadales bacterium]